jgi:DNA-binding SARP family transcriptional activator
MREQSGEPTGSGELEARLECLAAAIGDARAAAHPVLRAQRLAQVQRQSGWALREAVTECRERLGMTWRDTAAALQVPFGTLYRQYRDGGPIMLGIGMPGDGMPSTGATVPGLDRDHRPDLEILILGELVVRARGRPVRLPAPGLRALLGALLLGPGDVVGEDRLLELAWGTGKGSRRAMHCAVHRLRGWLQDVAGAASRLEHAGSGYRLALPDGSVDLTRFRDGMRSGAAAHDSGHRLALLSAALGEWRGPMLGGRPEWLAADPAVRAIEQARVHCATALADLALCAGRPGDRLATVERVAAAAPYDEPLQARLIRMLSASGRHAEALRHVERVRRRLSDDLGIAPSAEIRHAHAVALKAL